MPKTSHNHDAQKLITDYIYKLPGFTKAICNKLREIIFIAEPEIVEDWKWGPNYYKNGMVCGFGAFKQRVTFVFFKGAAMKNSGKIFNYGDKNMHNRSIKFKSIKEIDEKILIAYIREAVRLNKQGVKLKAPELPVPSDFKKALQKNNLSDKFDRLAYSHRKEYINWINSAKKIETKERRLDKAIEMIKQGLKLS